MTRARKRSKVLVLFDTAGTPPANQDFTKELKTDDWAAEAHVIEALKQLGFTEDEIFEHTVSAAVAAGLERLDAGLAALQ